MAVVLALDNYNSRRRAFVIRTYDAQKDAVDDALAGFVKALESDGFVVSDTSEGSSGSGEWRHQIVLSAKKPGEPQLKCYVEVMGFVTQDKDSRPTWYANLPMTISHVDTALDRRFLDLLAKIIQGHGWGYRVLM